MGTICAVICGANTVTEIAQYGQGKERLLRMFLELENGVPSHDTFRRVFMVLDAKAWQGVFFAWTRNLVLEQTDSPTEVRAVEGKFSRASGLHTLSVWASEHHVVLAQEQVPHKTNEITVIPVLEVLDIVGTTVTIDAAGTQKQIAWTAREHHANYVLALKGNHPKLFEDVKWLFSQCEDAAHWSMSEQGHGRTESREVWRLDDLSFLEDVSAWRDLAGVARVRCTRELKGVTLNERYFLTSHSDVTALAYAVRAHGGIENSRRWILEVAFNEDANRARTDHAQANLVTLRHLALNQKRETSLSASIKTKRMRAGWDDDYLLKVLHA